MIYYSMNDFNQDVEKLVKQITDSPTLTSKLTTYKGVFGIPRSGQLLAQAIAYKLGTFLLSEKQYIASNEKSKILIVDSNADKRDEYPDSDFACLHVKLNNSINYAIYSNVKDEIQYWWDEEKVEEIAANAASEFDFEDNNESAEQDEMDNSQRIQVLNHATTCMLYLDEMIKELS